MIGSAVLWDVGGTLVVLKTSPASPLDYISGAIVAAGIDLKRVPVERIDQTHAAYLANEPNWRTLDDEQRDRMIWVGNLTDGLGLSEATHHHLANQLRHYFDIFVPVSGIFDLLGELKQMGVRQAIVSNWPPSLLLFLKHHKLTDYFDAIIFSAEDGIHKPDPRIYQRALDRLKLRSEQAIFIGDNPEWDVKGPMEAGMRSIHFDPGRTYPTHDAADVPTLRQLLLKMIETSG